MRIVIDMQSLQTDSRFRGIGRYSFSLVNALLKQGKNIDYWILLNDHNKSDLARIRNLFAGLIDPGKVVSFSAPHAVNEAFIENKWRVRTAELIRSHFIAEMSPDIVLTTSLVEFDAVASIGPSSSRSYKSVVILYDLIPFAEPDVYLQNPLVRQWYERKIASLRNADLLLAISDYTRMDAVSKLGLHQPVCVNISAAADLIRSEINETCNVTTFSTLDDRRKNSVLYVGGFDVRKNVDKLIEAYSLIPSTIRNKYPLLLVGKIGDADKSRFMNLAKRLGIAEDCIEFAGYTPDDILVELYKTCRLFVFPSSNEGFGLPPLEAMHCGAPVIAAARTSLIEVVGSKEALFDPDDMASFVSIVQRGLCNAEFREYLKKNGAIQSKKFSWEITANKALDAITSVHCSGLNSYESGPQSIDTCESLCLKEKHLSKLIEDIGMISTESLPDDEELINVSNAIAVNLELLSSNEHDKLIRTKACNQLNNCSFDKIVPSFGHLPAPYAFSSVLCRAHHFRMPLYTYWCSTLREKPRFHRKQWEFVYICQTLFERGYLVPGMRAVGFGVGREPLVSLFAARGVSVLASDLDIENARRLGWVSSNQHSEGQAELNQIGLCDPEEFNRLVTYKNIDMNNIPSDLGLFNFCWSSCAFEHLGTIRRGLDFVLNSVRLLKPGGIAVHTTEFNVSSNDRTLDNNESFVIFRRQDIELLVSELQAEKYVVETIDYCACSEKLEQYVDLPPYQENLHLRLQLAGEFTATSIGLLIRKPL